MAGRAAPSASPSAGDGACRGPPSACEGVTQQFHSSSRPCAPRGSLPLALLKLLPPRGHTSLIALPRRVPDVSDVLADFRYSDARAVGCLSPEAGRGGWPPQRQPESSGAREQPLKRGFQGVSTAVGRAWCLMFVVFDAWCTEILASTLSGSHGTAANHAPACALLWGRRSAREASSEGGHQLVSL